MLNCAAVATYVVSQFMHKSRRLKKAKTHLHLYPSWNKHYFNSIQRQKESFCEGYSHKKTVNFDYDLLQKYVALIKIRPFTPLIIGTEMLTINRFGHDINAFVLPYDPGSRKAELLVFDAHGLVPKPWCQQRNFDKCYRINDIDVFDCQEVRNRVQEWMEKSSAYQKWRAAQSETALDYFEQDDVDSKIQWNHPAL